MLFIFFSNLSVPERRTASSQTEGIVTVITVGNPPGLPQTSSRPLDLPLPLARPPQLISKNASTSTRDINGQRQSLSLSRLPRGGAMSTSNVHVHSVATATTPTAASILTQQQQQQPHRNSLQQQNQNHQSSTITTITRPPSGPLIASRSAMVGSGVIGSSVGVSVGAAPSRQTSASQPLTELTTVIPQQIVRTTIAGSKAHDDRGEPRHLPTVTTAAPPPATQQPHAVSNNFSSASLVRSVAHTIS